MAFMGMFMAFIAVVAVILGVSAFIAFICFLSSGLIMLGLRKKHKDEGKIKKPWYVITLRVIGVLSTIPIVIAIGIVIFALIADAADKRTNLARAVTNYDYERVESILDNGTDPDMRDDYGRTLLMCIANHEVYVSAEDGTRYEFAGGYDWDDDEDIRMMEILLDHGADINAAVTDCGFEEAHEYEEGGWTDIYANCDHICGNTPLIFAVRYRSPEIIEFLIDNGADVNTANLCGFTPILICADTRLDTNGGLEIATMLLDEGADPDAVTNFHQDVIWLLTRSNTDRNLEMTELIESAMDGKC